MAGNMNIDIKGVNPKNMADKAGQIRHMAIEMNNNLSKAYAAMKQLYVDNNWRGNRYNDVSAAFNKQTECLNSILTTTVTDIPYAIEVAANNYSSADGKGRPYQENKKPKTPIENLPTTGQTDVMTYIPGPVHTTQKNIEECIKKAKGNLDSIITLFGEVKWKTEGASIAFKKMLETSRLKIDTAFKEVTAIINTQIDESDKAMADSEQNSTVNSSKA